MRGAIRKEQAIINRWLDDGTSWRTSLRAIWRQVLGDELEDDLEDELEDKLEGYFDRDGLGGINF